MDLFGSKKAKAAPVAAADAPAPPSPPAAVRANEVFTPSVPASRAFVGRKTEMKDLRKKGINVPGTQIVVWGESGAGKSSLVNKVLEEAGRTAVKTACTPDSTYEAILAAAFSGTGAFYITETTTNQDVTLSAGFSVGSELVGAKVSSEATYEAGQEHVREPIARPQLTPQRLVAELGARELSWVIEDFHKLPEAERKKVAHALKVFSDDGAKYPHTRVIALGVAESVEELVDPPANVGKRLIDIPVPPLDAGELGKILTAGEELLNLDFSAIRDRLLQMSVGTVSITHALALACCDERDIEEASAQTVVFTEADFQEAVAGYARTRSSTLKARFRKALIVHRRRKFANTELILRALAQLPEQGGSIAEILAVIRVSEPQYRHSNLNQYLAALQTDDRGALVRRTAAGMFRFDEPLQHVYAKSLFGMTDEPVGLEIDSGKGTAAGETDRGLVFTPEQERMARIGRRWLDEWENAVGQTAIQTSFDIEGLQAEIVAARAEGPYDDNDEEDEESEEV
jgi:hypothetical protein